MKMIDFRSDTITKPTEEMRKAMYEAEVGDDVYKEDVTINKLEELAAEIVGKEAALFVPSGTMGNLLGVMTHTRNGQEIILEEKSHIYNYEVTGYARLCGLGTRVIKGNKGKMGIVDIEDKIQNDNDIHHAATGLICIENTHNTAGGIVLEPNYIKEVKTLSEKYNIPIHMDGARVFNVATYLNQDVSTITKDVDSVMFCLSKGLGAPVGSILAGKEEYIERARHNRKMLGGGMRQAGILAAAGIIAITKMTKRLQEDHDNIKLLAEGLSQINGLGINLEDVQTNILMVNINISGMDSFKICEELKKENILASPFGNKKIRFVTNYHITRKDIECTIERINKIIKKVK